MIPFLKKSCNFASEKPTYRYGDFKKAVAEVVCNEMEAFQAKYGVGLDKLRQSLLDAAPKTADSDVIITNARHYEALCLAHDSLTRVLSGLKAGLSGDLIAEDLRLTLNHLADITGGLITPQETLNSIFAHFCIGK